MVSISFIKLFNKENLFLIFSFGFFGFLISYNQFYGISPDYNSYNDFFNLIRSNGLTAVTESRFEPLFSFTILFLSQFFNENIFIYSLVVLICLLLKGSLLRMASSSAKIFVIASVFYLVRYFSLHELTQIRAACAVTMLWLSAFYLWDKKFQQCILFLFLATLFHISSLVMIPALLLSASKRWQALGIGIIALLIIYGFTEIVVEYLAGHIKILDAYLRNGFFEVRPNPLSGQLLIDWVLIIASLILWRRLTLIMKHIVLIQIIGMAFFYGAIEFGIIAHRIRELYSTFWVFYIIDGLNFKSTRLLSYGFISLSLVYYLFIFHFSENFFE